MPRPRARGIAPRVEYDQQFPVIVTQKSPQRTFAEQLARKMADGDMSRVRWTGPLEFVVQNNAGNGR